MIRIKLCYFFVSLVSSFLYTFFSSETFFLLTGLKFCSWNDAEFNVLVKNPFDAPPLVILQWILQQVSRSILSHETFSDFLRGRIYIFSLKSDWKHRNNFSTFTTSPLTILCAILCLLDENFPFNFIAVHFREGENWVSFHLSCSCYIAHHY